jgi:uncharacterized membrane protein
MSLSLLLAVAIGFVAGLRSMTAPAVVAWGAHLGWLNLAGTPLRFMSSAFAVALFTLLAVLELVADLLPSTPSRTAPVGLLARAVTGGLSGACLSVGNGGGLGAGLLLGIVGAIGGAYAGYYTRRGLVKGLQVKDAVIAIPEDVLAIVLGCLIVR